MGLHSESFRFEGGGRHSEHGLKRTGKSCRLRWVNYLHPDLRRGKMSPHEERLVVELHAKLGNRWSRIAQKLPGRTDNEIKNYWRTHMRKKAQEMKQASPSSSSCSSFTSSSSINVMAVVDNDDRTFYEDGFAPSSLVSSKSYSSFDTIETNYNDTGGLEMLLPKKRDNEAEKMEKVISMDDIWKDIELFESEELSKVMISPIWNYCPDSSWATEEEVKMRDMVFPPTTDHFWHVPL